MAYKKGAVAIPFLVTFLVSLVLFGGTAWYMYTILVDESEIIDYGAQSLSSKIPDEKYDNTILLAFQNGTDDTDLAFVVMCCKPSAAKTVCVPVSPMTKTSVDGVEDSVGAFYRLNGIEGAQKAISAALEIEIDRYMLLDTYGLEKLHSIMGGVTVSVPSEYLDMTPGTKSVNSDQLAALMTFELYDGGEDFRTKFIGTAAYNMISHGFGEGLAERLDTSFETLAGASQTNITSNDYSNFAFGAKYLITNGADKCMLLFPEGLWTGVSFIMNEDFPDTLEDVLKS